MKCAVALFAFLTFAVAVPSASGAEFGIVPGSFKTRLLDAEGNQETRAGSHPDRLQIDFALNVEGTGTAVRDFAIELPPGLSASPGAVPECPREIVVNEEECPAESQVGTLTLKFTGGGVTSLPLFELEPEPDEIIAFGSLPAFDVPLSIELRPDDFGATFHVSDIPEAPISEGHIELWGIPADHQVGTGISRRSLLTAPTGCGPMVFAFSARSWEAGASWLSTSTEAEAPLSGCQGLTFEPQLRMQLDNPLADSPTGARIDLNMTEESDPDGQVNGQIKEADIQLPEGLTVSPGAVDQIVACSEAQLGLGETTPVSCPASSRIGAIEIQTPQLADPLSGDVYLGEGTAGEPLRMFVAAARPGLVAKFIGTMHPDRASGRLSAVLEDLPQLPLSRLTLIIDGGSRALLASPLTCGSFASTADLESYGGAPASLSTAVTIGAGPNGSPCQNPAPFSPKLQITSSRHAAGRTTVFSMILQRRAGEQLTRRFSASLPMGLSAALGGIEVCPDAAAPSGACPPGSKIGDAAVALGSGSSLAAIDGDVYLGGPYRRAPFSMIIALRAALGPFDLGKTAIRSALQVDPRSGRVRVHTDPLPELIDGIPVRIQRIEMTLSRPGVVRNPTSCSPAESKATIEASGGATVMATSTFAVTKCDKLGFKPRFSVALGSSGLHKHGKPSLRIAARFRQADTNLRAMHLALPKGLQFNASGLREICPRQDAVNGLCSKKALIGTSFARSPMLSEPLEGSIFIVQPPDDGLPELWVRLEATGLQVDLTGGTSQRDGRFVTNLVGLPDVPLSAFAMRLRGGRHGVLSLATEPCRHRRAPRLVARLALKGQNGAQRELGLRAGGHCGGASSRHRQQQPAE